MIKKRFIIITSIVAIAATGIFSTITHKPLETECVINDRTGIYCYCTERQSRVQTQLSTKGVAAPVNIYDYKYSLLAFSEPVQK